LTGVPDGAAMSSPPCVRPPPRASPYAPVTVPVTGVTVWGAVETIDWIDPATRTAKVRAVIANRDGALKLDMFARISVPTTEQREAMVVPVDAVQQIDNQPVVFVRQSGTRFERRDVTLGASAADVVEILGGVEPGETVVAAGSFYLKTALLRERIGDEH